MKLSEQCNLRFVWKHSGRWNCQNDVMLVPFEDIMQGKLSEHNGIYVPRPVEFEKSADLENLAKSPKSRI